MYFTILSMPYFTKAVADNSTTLLCHQFSPLFKLPSGQNSSELPMPIYICMLHAACNMDINKFIQDF